MLTKRERTSRFFTGLAVVIVFLAASFSAANLYIPDWGSTPEERSLALPGDVEITSPVMEWNHGLTIDASPEQVWPWIIQMGDTRGGFYSYMWIEKATNLLFGISPSESYNNANEVRSEWQNPPVGQGMILDAVVIRHYEPNSYLFAGPNPDANETGLYWGWYLRPASEGRTRLLVRMYVQIPGAESGGVPGAAMNILTFMMERKMMDGIKLRAEGGSEAPWVQAAELLAGLAALAAGLAAARQFMTRPGWKVPLAVGLASIAAMFIMVYIQPAMWVRLVLDLALVGSLAWNVRAAGSPTPAPGKAPQPEIG